MNRHPRYRLSAVICTIGVSLPLMRAQSLSTYVPVTPCRVVDTRGTAGNFGGPTLTTNTSRSFPIPASSCGIPANASAYSFNLAVVPAGPLGYVTVWPTGVAQPGTANLNSTAGQVLSNAVLVAAGTNGAVSVYVSDTTDIILDITGYFLAQSDSTSTSVGTGASNAGLQNTALGFNTLEVNSGNGNTATGAYALSSNSSGSNNVAIGTSALLSNSSGSANTAVGTLALANNYSNDNTAVGVSALWTNNVGADNTAMGTSALFSNTGGSYNVALGQNALFSNTAGSWNVGIGYQAGTGLVNGNYNIFIANPGQSSDSNVIRIGTQGTQTNTYIAGIFNTNVAGSSVLINSSGQLGIATSSERFKEEIADMGKASDELMLLRPVTFRYKQPFDDGTRPLQYGLLGEEVAKVYPQLVVYGADGQIQSVQYQQLPALLLNEVQKQHRTIEQQEMELGRQKEEMRALETRIAAMEASMADERQPSGSRPHALNHADQRQ